MYGTVADIQSEYIYLKDGFFGKRRRSRSDSAVFFALQEPLPVKSMITSQGRAGEIISQKWKNVLINPGILFILKTGNGESMEQLRKQFVSKTVSKNAPIW